MLYKLGQQNKAEGFERELTDKDLNDRETKKVRLAFNRSRFNRKEYAESLCEYIKDNGDDKEAWLELAILYERALNFDRAVYCYEELLLLDPENFALYLKLAEVNYTIGKVENLKVARQLFCFLLNINRSGVRCLWGLYNTCQALIKWEKGNEDNKKILEIVEKRLEEIYKGNTVVRF